MTEAEIFDQFVNKVRIKCQGGLHHWITWDMLTESQKQEWRVFAKEIYGLTSEYRNDMNEHLGL